MRVIPLVKSTADSEAGIMPGQELLEAMGQFNADLIEAGVMVDGNGLKPTSQGGRVWFDGDTRTVEQGPFDFTEDLVAGYWVWQVRDMEAALEWAKRCPNPVPDPSTIEVPPLYEPEDFA